jgi:hypothetical protein
MRKEGTFRNPGPPGEQGRRLSARAWGRLFCLVAIGVLYGISVPWYRAADEPLRIWLGLPDWVTVALLCYVGVAVLNGLAWACTEVTDAPEVPGEGEVGE